MNNYNANIYLTPTDLNDIENMVEDITNDIQEKIFDNTQSSLRNIQVGDNLSGKTLYLSFPRDTYESINNTTRVDLITIDTNTRIAYIYNNNKKYVYIKYNVIDYFIYAKDDNSFNPYLNFVRVKLPYNFGTVTEIDSSDDLFQYIKIYDNENIIPNYVKNTYSANDLPTMKQIDNIEQGIKNISDYYYRPSGFIGAREWLGTAELGADNNYGVGIKNISYQDLNRWTNNLNLIDFDDIDMMCIWNSDISNISWDIDNDEEWEEF